MRARGRTAGSPPPPGQPAAWSQAFYYNPLPQAGGRPESALTIALSIVGNLARWIERLWIQNRRKSPVSPLPAQPTNEPQKNSGDGAIMAASLSEKKKASRHSNLLFRRDHVTTLANSQPAAKQPQTGAAEGTG